MPQTFYLGIKGIIVDSNKVLLLKCKDAKQNYYWDLPGGRIEEGETIIQALTRELEEELPTITNITVGNLIGAHKLPHKLSSGHGLMLLMYKINAHLPTITLSNEHSEYKWVSKNDLKHIGQEAQISQEYIQIVQHVLLD
ncbi:hypothetical protein BH09DEP1_BH09DEP1_3260 [soil metagenome]